MHIRALAIVVALVVTFSTNASATHKSWWLTDPGANCHPAYSGTTGVMYTDGAIYNSTSTQQSVVCPVTLAGRFASQGSTSFPMATWAAANRARLYGAVAYASTLTCSMQVSTSTGSLYYSNTLAGGGDHVILDFQPGGAITNNGSWGGTLGVGNTLVVRSMGYFCFLPGFSRIYSYNVGICQRSFGANCHL